MGQTASKRAEHTRCGICTLSPENVLVNAPSHVGRETSCEDLCLCPSPIPQNDGAREVKRICKRCRRALPSPVGLGGPGLKCWPLCWEEQSFRERREKPLKGKHTGLGLDSVSSDAGKEIVRHVLIYTSPVSPGQTHGCSVNMGWPTAHCLGSTTPDTRMFRKHLLCSCASGFYRDAPKRLPPGSAPAKQNALSGAAALTALTVPSRRRAFRAPGVQSDDAPKSRLRYCLQQTLFPAAWRVEHEAAGDAGDLAACALTVTLRGQALGAKTEAVAHLPANPEGDCADRFLLAS